MDRSVTAWSRLLATPASEYTPREREPGLVTADDPEFFNNNLYQVGEEEAAWERMKTSKNSFKLR